MLKIEDRLNIWDRVERDPEKELQKNPQKEPQSKTIIIKDSFNTTNNYYIIGEGKNKLGIIPTIALTIGGIALMFTLSSLSLNSLFEPLEALMRIARH